MATNSSNSNSIIINAIIAHDDDDDKFGLNNTLDKPARLLRRKTQTKLVHRWVKQNKDAFKQEDHTVQLLFDITTLEDGKQTIAKYNTSK